MALKKVNNKQNNAKVADCVIQESTKRDKIVRKKYSSKKTEFQVRKRTAEKIVENICRINTCQYNFEPQSIQSANTMFYPPCPQYYPVTNEWNPVIPIQCPLYSLQPIPVIVNPIMSTQISPYPIVVPPVTVASEFAIAPLVSTNEFSLHMTEVSSSIVTNESHIYCEVSPIVDDLSNGYSNLAVCNEVALTPLNTCPSYATQLTNEMAPVTPTLNEFSPLTPFDSYEFSPLTPMSEIFSPINSIQVPNEFIPTCTVASEISPLSHCDYESPSYEYFEYELPIVDETDHNYVPEYEYVENPLEHYLLLPKDLFPTAWMMTIDPNSIIDEFCSVLNLDDYSWILDLEFGAPKTPVTRRVATYNVKLNSINCKNTPEAIHPGFEECDKDLKRVLMFYYDCVISNWYRGYISLNSDKSVENFQTWLHLPMQTLGMCWP